MKTVLKKIFIVAVSLFFLFSIFGFADTAKAVDFDRNSWWSNQCGDGTDPNIRTLRSNLRATWSERISMALTDLGRISKIADDSPDALRVDEPLVNYAYCLHNGVKRIIGDDYYRSSQTEEMLDKIASNAQKYVANIEVAIEMASQTEVTITVKDQDGDPIERALVKVRYPTEGTSESSYFLNGETNSSGVVKFDKVFAGRKYVFVILKTGFQIKELEKEMAEFGNEFSVSLTPGTGMEGDDETEPGGPGVGVSDIEEPTINLAESLNSAEISKTWGAVLDLVNIVVILILLAIAFLNILRIDLETFHLKRLLPALIIGIILANFSHLICRIIIDFATVLQDYFIPDPKQASIDIFLAFIGGFISNAQAQATAGLTASSLIAALFLASWILMPGVWIVLLGVLFLLILLLLFPAIILLILALLLYVRIYVVWFLVIVSPLAFLFAFFPPTKQFFEMWWSNFVKWVFMAPLAMFAIWLALTFANSSLIS